LFAADGCYAVAVVEAVPELGDDEEVGAFHEAFFYGAGYALPGFDFVAVIWGCKLAFFSFFFFFFFFFFCFFFFFF
jgi:hypothetical protein